MTTLTEARQRMVGLGTARAANLKKAIKIGVWATAGVLGILLLTVWVIGAINSNIAQQDEGKVVVTRTAAAPVDPVCNQRKVAYRFGTAEPAEPFNSAGQCAPDLWHDGHCLWIRQAGSTRAIKHCQGEMPPDVESAWSADTAFSGFIKLSPPRYTTLVRLK